MKTLLSPSNRLHAHTRYTSHQYFDCSHPSISYIFEGRILTEAVFIAAVTAVVGDLATNSWDIQANCAPVQEDRGIQSTRFSSGAEGKRYRSLI
ncbi:hypothetical protein BOTBODRAFT_381940 [Botryobasidium botryosum FD-172 SS1]|uniref:Uncharacterized protein n=1 Tax=Botryobasidium botryosum (strain FD-172 SS1) TaxID=930990 RepID=A0A067N846_BOTB1|nr:hypothetical protein BOTBODRAFT_381940 [Botryobasidium botryosum FD-172 SS1]